MNGFDLSFSTFGKSIFSLIRVASGEYDFKLKKKDNGFN